MILLVNAIVDKFTKLLSRQQVLVYGGLLVSILCSYFLPTDALLAASADNQTAVYAIMTIVTILPMGIAAIIFASAFAKVPNVNQALAFNLFGAVVGGLLEYLSNYWGIRSLDLVASLLYAASFLAYLRVGKGGVELSN